MSDRKAHVVRDGETLCGFRGDDDGLCGQCRALVAKLIPIPIPGVLKGLAAVQRLAQGGFGEQISRFSGAEQLQIEAAFRWLKLLQRVGS